MAQMALACLTAALLNKVSKGLSHCQHSSMESPPASLPTDNLLQLTLDTVRLLGCPSGVEGIKNKLAVCGEAEVDLSYSSHTHIHKVKLLFILSQGQIFRQ